MKKYPILFVLLNMIVVLPIFGQQQRYKDPVERIYGIMRMDSLRRVFNEQFYCGDYMSAIITGNNWLNETIAVHGPETKETGLVYLSLANTYSKERDFNKARDYATLGKDVIGTTYGTTSENYAIIIDNLSKYYSELGEFEKGYEESKIAVPLWGELTGIESLDYAIALGNFAINADGIGNIDEAIELCNKELEILNKLIGKNNEHYASALDNIANFYFHKGYKEKSIICNLEAYNIWKYIVDKDSWDWAICIGNLSNHYFDMEEYEAALNFLPEVIDFYEKHNGKEHPIYITFLLEQMTALNKLEKYEESLIPCEKIYQIYSSTDSSTDAETCNKMEKIYISLLSKCKKVEKLDEIVAINNNRNKNLFKDKINNIKHLLWLGLIYYSADSETKSEEYFKMADIYLSKLKNKIKALDIYVDLFNNAFDSNNLQYAYQWGKKIMDFRREKSFDKVIGQDVIKKICKSCDVLEHYNDAIDYSGDWIDMIQTKDNNVEKYTDALLNIATFHSHNGNYDEAIKLDEECVTLIDSITEVNDEMIIRRTTALNNLCKYYAMVGEYEKGILCGQRSLTYKDRNSQEYAITLGNIASCYADLGDLSKAIQMNEEAISLIESNGNINTLSYSSLLMNVGNDYCAIGDYRSALESLHTAYKSQCDYLGEKHSASLLTLSNLATVYATAGDYKSAASFQGLALERMEEIWGENNIYYIKALSNFAYITRHLDLDGYEKKALDVEFKALELKKKYLGEKHPGIITSLLSIAQFYVIESNIEKAIPFYEQAIELQRELYGINNLDFYEQLAESWYIKLNNNYEIKEVEKDLIFLYCDRIIPVLKEQFGNMREDLRNYYWIANSYLGEVLSFLCDCSSDDVIKDACSKASYKFSLARKGLMINSSTEFYNILKKEDQEILVINEQLDSLYLSHRNIIVECENKENLSLVKGQIRNLENKLVELSKKHGDFSNQMDFNYQTIISHLGQHDVAIEFVQYKGKKNAPKYAAIVVSQRDTIPQFIPLFEEKELKNLVDEDDKTGIYTNKSVSELVWGKLQSSLEGVENVYFAPDGILHQIAIEYLPDCDGDGMISDRYNLHRLSSTREIALNRHNAPTRDAVLYGGIKYDTDVKTMETESRKYEKPQNRGFNPYYNLTDSLSLRGSLDYLAGSLTEAENINGMMKANNYNITLLTDTIATEESFKNLSGKANGIIHISTHGFYWTESEAERKASHNDRLMFMSQLGENSRRNVEDKALTRTGLFMAGAMNALKGDTIPEGVDDGILTAQEIANLDLRGLDLVVLSACQTGMGDISGDGVFGLQRGFKKAGANTILMSLWDVNDDATQILMTNFYKNYLGGMSKQQALRQAQKTVRETSGFSDPKYWAAFILLDALN